MFKRSAILFALCIPFSAANAAICSNSLAVPSTTPSNQFTLVASPGGEEQDAPVVVDNKTGLMWERCSHEFTWNSVSGVCESTEASAGGMIWSSALDKAIGTNSVGGNLHLGYNDWRLPNLKELASIIEQQCQNLTINQEIFPGSMDWNYWTNTHLYGLKNDGSTEIRVVDFRSGVVDKVSPQSNAFLRLVRDPE